MLKIGWRHPEILDETDGLRVWNGDGPVRLFGAWNEDDVNGLLLEHCEPGIEFEGRAARADQGAVVAALLQRLWIDPPAGRSVRPLQEICALWALACKQRLVRSPPPDPGLVKEGLAVWDELEASPSSGVLLLTDLHGSNVLSAARAPWLVIDPSLLWAIRRTSRRST